MSLLREHSKYPIYAWYHTKIGAFKRNTGTADPLLAMNSDRELIENHEWIRVNRFHEAKDVPAGWLRTKHIIVVYYHPYDEETGRSIPIKQEESE